MVVKRDVRIVIPIVSLEKGGGTRFLHEVGSGLHDYGHDVHFVLVEGKHINYSLRAKVSYVPQLLPDLMPEADIILPNFYSTVYASLSGRGMPVRLCLSYEPFFVDQAGEAKQTYKLPMPVATISTWLQQILTEQVGRRSVVINPGVDHRFFSPTSMSRYHATIVCLGRNPEAGYAFKGLPQFLEAMSLIKTRKSVQVIVISPDIWTLRTPFPAVLANAPTDFELANLYRQATVFVFPSMFEGFGLPPLEAMACGTPVITTRCGGVSDFARHEENCLMVTPGDVNGLAEAILRLLGDPPLRRRLSDAAVDTARPWTWTRTVDQMDHFLRRVLAGQYAL